MNIEVHTTAAAAASRAAELLTQQMKRAIAERGLAAIALSGGKTPAGMLNELTTAKIDWQRVHVFQVDERLVAEDDERRNIRLIREAFSQPNSSAARLHAMPVHGNPIEKAAHAYAADLCAIAGTPPVLDAVHLGLGNDGHTASLFPGDPAADAGGDVALSGAQGGLSRMTLTFEIINRARARIWLVTGASKRAIVERLLAPGANLIANRVRVEDCTLLLDRDSAAGS